MSTSYVDHVIGLGQGREYICDCCGQRLEPMYITDWWQRETERWLTVCVHCLKHRGMKEQLLEEGWARR
jgi:hypothetical protein